jgi:hypothetical protein
MGIAKAQDNQREQVKKSIETFFNGLHNGDTAIISSVLNKDMKLQTTGKNREGAYVLSTQEKNNFLKGVASKNPEDKWFEKLLSYEIHIDGSLASVWTPYEFYRNDEFSHCGVNSFQLFNNSGNWEIVYLIDTRKREGCKILE